MNEVERFEIDRRFGKTFDRPEWVTEAKSIADKIIEIDANEKPITKVETQIRNDDSGGNSTVNIYWEGFNPISNLMPSLDKWLKDNDAVINYWFLSQPRGRTNDIKYMNPDLGIYCEDTRNIEDKIKFDSDPVKREKYPSPKVSLTLPLDEGNGFEGIRVYKYGDPPYPQQYQTTFWNEEKTGLEEHGNHGTFRSKEVELVFDEPDAKNKPVMINSWQPHSWHKSNAVLNRRLVMRLSPVRNGKIVRGDDPWNLFDKS